MKTALQLLSITCLTVNEVPLFWGRGQITIRFLPVAVPDGPVPVHASG
jgi:hypothetical protein